MILCFKSKNRENIENQVKINTLLGIECFVPLNFMEGQKRIMIVNMKGGVGKTTLSTNFAYVLSKFEKKKVLIVDIDPQFNATQYLVNQKDILNHFKVNKTVYDILMPDKEEDVDLAGVSQKKSLTINISDYIINIKNFENGSKLDLLPSSLKLINFETSKRGAENYLKNFINSYCSEYDFILYDCPPTLSVLTISAYLASSHYLIPIKPDYLSSLGLPMLERGLKEYEDTYGHNLQPLGIVFTMVNNTSTLPNEIIESIAQSGKRKLYTSKLSHSVMVARSIGNNISSLEDFYRNASTERYATEYKNVTTEILNTI
ncbi:MAG: ParA family protein [Bacteroidetes bacterium]|nr:ParA family protein [Bacteroidota bacterium]MCL2302946.1 ParA family protein [Lentimicrobiaceae bacterium]